MTTRIKLRRDTAANWLAANPILAAGEPGLETDTGKIKYGDGVTAYAALPHAGGDTLNDEGGVTVTAGSTKYWVAAQRRENYNTYGRGVRHDSLGNVYSLTQTYDGNDDVAVITKYSPVGVLLWQHSIDDVTPVALAVDSSNCAYITLDNSSNINLIKFTANGDIAWKKSYNAGTWQGEAFIEERTATRLALVANRQDPSVGQVLVFDINTADGSVVTQKIISNGSDYVWASGIDTDGDGNVFVIGRYYDSGPEKDKMFVEKLDENLDRVWSKSLQTDNNYDMTGGDCASDAQGNVYAVGFYSVDSNNFNGSNTSTAGVLIKLNSSGVVQWTRRIGPGPCDDTVAGLTATDTGDVYLVSSTLEFKRDQRQLDAYEEFFLGTTRMILAKYDTAGAVLWQRYVDAKHAWESNDDFRGQTISEFDGKIVVDFYGESWNTTPFTAGDSADNEADYYLVQLPADGTELEIGDLAFKASRVPGRFVTHATSASPTTNEVLESTVTVATSSLSLDEAARVSNALVRSETYDYVFGADGTLTIPNDGDVRLTQNQMGYFAVIGDTVNYNNDVQGRAVTADSQGNTYAVGEDDDFGKPVVVKISPEGQRLWGVAIENDANGNNGRANSIAVNPANGNLIVACEFYGNYYYGVIVTIDQDTGRILSNSTYTDDNNDVYLNDIVFQSTGSWVVGGSKNGEFSPDITATPQTGSALQKIVVLRSQVAGPVDTNWQITGTSISVYENIASVEQYSNLTGTVRQGSGAQFPVANNGDGTYAVGTITTAGTNYRIGHKLLFLGTDLGGATPDNDCVVRITGVDGDGGVTNIEVSSGTAVASAYTLYSDVVGTNYNVGSGFSFSTFNGPTNSSNYYNNNGSNVGNFGTNYTIGDVITFLGTDLGGTAPANNMTVTVTYIGAGGEAYGYDISGTAQTTNWNITTTSAVDFSLEGAWTFTYPLSRENLLIGDGWMRTYGTNTGDRTDRTYAITVDTSDNIIVASMGYGLVSAGQGSYDLAVIYKFNSTGTLQWAKQLNETDYDCEAKGVTTIGTDIYATHYSQDNGDTIVTKLLADGTVKWQRRTGTGSDSSISASTDGNLVVVAEAYNDDIGDDAIKLFKMSPDGETIYKRWLSADTEHDTRFKNGRCLAIVGGNMYITSYYYADDYDSWFVARLPEDGSGTCDINQFRYTDVNPQTDSYIYNANLNNFNYSLEEVSGGYAGALTVAPYVNTTDLGISGEGAFYVDSYYPPYFWEDIRDLDGGNIVFADGTVQSTSATDTPQRIYTGAKYTLGLRDRGHHIYCNEQNRNILIPYNARVEFPIGTTITIVNDSGSSVYIATEGGGTGLIVAGNGYYGGAEVYNNGVATLIKVQRERWVIYGNVGPW